MHWNRFIVSVSLDSALSPNLKFTNGKTAKPPEVLIAADISSGSRFLWRGLFNFCFFMSFRICISHSFYPGVDRFFFGLSLPFRVLCLCWSKAGS